MSNRDFAALSRSVTPKPPGGVRPKRVGVAPDKRKLPQPQRGGMPLIAPKGVCKNGPLGELCGSHWDKLNIPLNTISELGGKVDSAVKGNIGARGLGTLRLFQDNGFTSLSLLRLYQFCENNVETLIGMASAMEEGLVESDALKAAAFRSNKNVKLPALMADLKTRRPGFGYKP